MLRKVLKSTLFGCCVALMMAANPAVVEAADFEVETVFEDALYGGAIGALVGAGLMLVSSSPSNNLDYIMTGAGVGIIAGAAYGVFTSSRAFAEIDDGKMVVGIPTPKLSVQTMGESTVLAMEADLVKLHF
jgi:hypothetical protein